MADRGINYESLKNRWQREVNTGPQDLTRLDPRFYERVEGYLDELEEEYQREHDLDPTSGKAMLLRDELFNLRKILEDLYDQRERKVLLLALTAARGGEPDRSNMTDGEVELFESVVEALEEGRRQILGGPERDLGEAAPKATPVPDDRPDPPEEPLDAYEDDGEGAEAPSAAEGAPEEPPDPAPGRGDAPEAGDRDPAPPEPAPPGGEVTRADPREDDDAGPEATDDASGEGLSVKDSGREEVPPPEADPEEAAGSGRVVVRVTEGVPAFAASDERTYDLEAEDVVCLPPNAAEALVDRGKAVRVSTPARP